MQEEFKEYATFTTTNREGNEIEMAVVDEFEFEKKHYIVGAVIKGDEIVDDGRYIYRCVMKDGEINAEKITCPSDYEKVVKAYMEME